MMVAKEQTKIVVETTMTIANAIKSLKRVPSGHLYAQLMCYVGIDEYTAIIDFLVHANLVQKTNSHELIWIG